MSKKGSLVIISGFSGAGKGTVVKELMKNYECYALSISATTRNPRPGEENGREYFFKTKEEFEELIRQDALYEYAQYVDNYYGTPKAYVEEQLAAGKDVILEIEVQGALKVKEKNPQALLLFVTPAICGRAQTPSDRSWNGNHGRDQRPYAPCCGRIRDHGSLSVSGHQR